MMRLAHLSFSLWGRTKYFQFFIAYCICPLCSDLSVTFPHYLTSYNKTLFFKPLSFLPYYIILAAQHALLDGIRNQTFWQIQLP
jgi:hypothetical protein